MYKPTYSSIIFFFWSRKDTLFHLLVSSFYFSRIPGFSAIYRSLYLVEDKRLETEVFGEIQEPSRTCRFDKDAKLYKELSNLVLGL
jgi:dihydroorotate dehydrogenase